MATLRESQLLPVYPCFIECLHFTIRALGRNHIVSAPAGPWRCFVLIQQSPVLSGLLGAGPVQPGWGEGGAVLAHLEAVEVQPLLHTTPGARETPAAAGSWPEYPLPQAPRCPAPWAYGTRGNLPSPTPLLPQPRHRPSPTPLPRGREESNVGVGEPRGGGRAA